MREWKEQTHVTWHCLYHIIFILKYRKKAISGRLRQEIGQVFHELCAQFGIELVEGYAQPDHIRMCLSIPPQYAVAQAGGRLKDNSAILIHRRYLGKEKNLTRYHFGARGYCVSTVGLDEAIVRQYIRDQEAYEQQLDQLMLPLK